MINENTEINEKIVELYKKGVSQKKISKELSVTSHYVSEILGRNGLISCVKGGTYDLYGKKIFNLWQKGKNKSQIANELGITKNKVRYVLRNYGYLNHDNHDTNIWLEKLKAELLSYGFEYISGYNKYDSEIRIKDLSNGTEFNVNCHNFIQRKRNNKISEHYELDRNKKITLRGLYKMFDGVCYICGEKCDFGDWWLNENGARCFGGNYPSIEHKTPRSRGGKTQWGNVLLAHRKCNSVKNTKTEEEANIEVCI